MCICVYVYVYMCMYTYVYIYMYKWKELLIKAICSPDSFRKAEITPSYSITTKAILLEN